MKASIKVTELVCLKVVSNDGTSAAIPLEQTFYPNGFDVFTNESGNITVIRHISSGDCLVLDEQGIAITDEALVRKFLK